MKHLYQNTTSEKVTKQECSQSSMPPFDVNKTGVLDFVNEMGRACSTHGEKRNAYRILVEARRKETTRKT
jgi:hypothetical protein